MLACSLVAGVVATTTVAGGTKELVYRCETTDFSICLYVFLQYNLLWHSLLDRMCHETGLPLGASYK